MTAAGILGRLPLLAKWSGRMIQIKTPQEIELMRGAGLVVAGAIAAVRKTVRPGVSTAELDAIAEDFIRSAGAVPSFLGYHGFPASICASPNDMVVHGIPGRYTLREGDILSVDVGVTLDGFVGDSAWTYGVGMINPRARRLLEVTEGCLWAALKAARAGNRLGDISHAIQSWAEARGYGVVRKYTSHGVGRRLHEPPEIRNYGEPGKGMLLRPGMTMAIEPMITEGSYESRELDDGWTVVTIDGKLSAHFEHTIAITPEGEPEIMTLRVE